MMRGFVCASIDSFFAEILYISMLDSWAKNPNNKLNSRITATTNANIAWADGDLFCVYISSSLWKKSFSFCVTFERIKNCTFSFLWLWKKRQKHSCLLSSLRYSLNVRFNQLMEEICFPFYCFCFLFLCSLKKRSYVHPFKKTTLTQRNHGTPFHLPVLAADHCWPIDMSPNTSWGSKMSLTRRVSSVRGTIVAA